MREGRAPASPRTSLGVIVVGAIAIGAAAPAHAEEPASPAAAGSSHDDGGFAPGAVELDLTVEANLSTNQVGQPISLAPDVFVAVSRRLMLGVVHSARALAEVGSGDGICLGGVAHGCEQAYSNLGLDARYLVVTARDPAGGDDGLVVAAHARLVSRRFDPWLPSARLGALARWRRGRFTITADPYLQLGLDNLASGNRHAFAVPLWFEVAPTCRFAAYLRTGVAADFATLTDAYKIPFAVGVRVAVTPRIDLAAEAGFVHLGGPINDAKLRAGWIGVDLRWP